MKKIFSIMLIAIAAIMMSSCIITLDTYDITCYNNTYDTVTDWCVKRNETTTYANSEYARRILSGKKDTIENLPKGDYRIFVAFDENPQEEDYWASNIFELDEDVELKLSDRRIYSRSASPSEDSSDSGKLYLICSNGKTLELFPCSKEEFNR